jgi:hypothetical protein
VSVSSPANVAVTERRALYRRHLLGDFETVWFTNGKAGGGPPPRAERAFIDYVQIFLSSEAGAKVQQLSREAMPFDKGA